MRVAVLGAAGDTGNLGVTALLYSVLAHLFERGDTVVAADHGRGVRQATDEFGGSRRQWAKVGLVHTRRWYRPESLMMLRGVAPLAPGLLATSRALRDADLVLDVSGGDSFTDIYGPKRFAAVLQHKQLVLRLGTPLALLPQTYGPFTNATSRAAAAQVVRAAQVCASRDAVSHAALLELLGPHHDPDRHLEGVDVAFALPVKEPDEDQDPAARTWLEERDRGRPLAGINVSGLIAHDAARFDIRLDYVAAVRAAVRALVDDGADVLLIPHMAGTSSDGSPNREIQAARRVHEGLGDLGDHVHVLRQDSEDPRQAKWWMGHCSWFTGPRMHATIGALTQEVPTLATAYSVKVAGVFATAGQADAVVDLAALDRAGFVDALLASFRQREQRRASLARTIPDLRRGASAQLDELLSAATASSRGDARDPDRR